MKRIITPSLMLALLVFASGCKSIPSLAVVSVKDQSAVLEMDEKKIKPDNLMLLKKAVISEDRHHLLLVADEKGEMILFDTAEGKIINKPDVALAIDGRNIPVDDSSDAYHQNGCSPEKSYCAEVSGPLHKRVVRVMRADGTDVPGKIDWSWTTAPGMFLFVKKDLLALRFSGGSNEFRFISIPSLKTVKSYNIPYTTAFTGNLRLSLSADKKGDYLVLHDCKLVQIYRTRDQELVANLMMRDRDNWIVVSSEGYFEGTQSMIDALVWRVGEERIPLANFDRGKFYRKGLLGHVLGLEAKKPKTAARKAASEEINAGERLIGKVRKIDPSGEIIVASGKKPLVMGEKVFVILEGKKVTLEVTYPMMTVAKCRASGSQKASARKIRTGMPVFK